MFKLFVVRKTKFNQRTATMFRNYLLLLLLTIGFITLPGCSLFSSDNEEGEETTAEESSEDGSEVVESEEGDTSTEVSESSDASSNTEELAVNTDEEEVIDEYPDDDYGDDSATTTASSDLPEQPVESTPATTTSDETLYVSGEESAATEATTDESTSSTDETASRDAIVDQSGSVGTAGFIPVRKMKRTPYNAAGVLLNRLYIARDGDSLSSVAEKIYGDGEKQKDLASWNSSLAGKSLKVGDKIYYNSPRNPADSSQILLYYEEAGIQPQTYTAKSGDSIRKVSQELLGHSRSWMEVWATNEVESKWQMQEGTTLRYWPSGSAGSVPVQQAATQEEAPAATAEAAAPAEEADALAEGGQNVATNTEDMAAPTEDLPPSEELPVDDMGAAAQVAQGEEPPPPSDMAPPPPPPPTDAVAPPEAPTESGGIADLMSGQDDTTMIAVLGGLLLVAAFILLIFLKRGRKKVNYS